MNSPRSRFHIAIMISVGASAIFAMTDCSSRSLPKGAIGNLGQYNYSPSIIEAGGKRQFWWCSPGPNPTDPSQNTDAIYYQSIDLASQKSDGPTLVLAETAGSWDSAFICNPKVVGGVFENPLADGNTYKYAMYYVATQWISGRGNSIGVAFSLDGMNWKKYPQPIIPATTGMGYGVGQPSVVNLDHKAAIYLFYEDTYPTLHHVAATSIDGLHFSIQGTVTTTGLDSDNPEKSWGDMAYDTKTGEWYAVFNRPLRPVETTGGVIERGQYGVELYKIKEESLFTGELPWQQLAIMDTNSTGFESNFLSGFVRDFYGDVNAASYPAVEMYTTISYPPASWNATPTEAGNSAAVEQWILIPMKWTPDADAKVPFNRYFNGRTHEVTTGWISPNSGFALQQALGHLFASPVEGATVPIYGCKRGETDYFVSLDVECEGQRILGKQGYTYAQSLPGRNLSALYRCSTSQDHFVSQDPKCENQTTDGLLGYFAP
jgi:hypothetical protein